MKIIMPGERPVSWNKMYAGVNHWKRTNLAHRYHALVRLYLPPDIPSFTYPVKIVVAVYFGSHPMDADNIASKLLIDGLVRAGWLPDDKPQYVRSVETVSLMDKANPRIELEIVD